MMVPCEILGLKPQIVVKRNEPSVPAKELIIISRSVLHGLLTSIYHYETVFLCFGY